MYTLTIWSQFEDKDYKIKPIDKNKAFASIRSIFHSPQLYRWSAEEVVVKQTQNYINNGQLYSEEDIVSVNFEERVVEIDSVKTVQVFGSLLVRGVPPSVDHQIKTRKKHEKKQKETA